MRKYLLVVILALSLLLPIQVIANSSSSLVSDPPKYAIVIGIGTQFSENLGSDGDAVLMARILRQNGFSNGNIKLLKNSDATWQNVRDAIWWLIAKSNEQSEVVLFFSGHSGIDFLVLWDYGLGASELNGYLSPLTSTKILICIQGCYSGSFIDNLSAPNRVIITSATDYNVSVDSGRLSLWGTLFLDYGISKGRADLNGDGKVSMQEAYDYSNLGWMSDQYGQDFYL